jgi:hypothetical protein
MKTFFILSPKNRRDFGVSKGGILIFTASPRQQGKTLVKLRLD